jgi:hypothetical protein
LTCKILQHTNEVMKFEDLVGEPLRLELDSADARLPTTADLFKYAHYLIENAKNDKTYWTLSTVYNKVARDLTQLYGNRNIPTISLQSIVRYVLMS